MGAKKLIEVALPLESINKESAREKSIRHGHPSTLHLWWARRPLAAARAVIWSSLVDDPSSHPEQFPTEEAQNAERERLFRILEKLVVWENSNNPEVLDEARAEIMKSTGGNPPALLDPFAGGGAIPLEAQRLGLEAHAHDLNPVAVMINKAMIEIPPRFAGQPPIHPGKTELDDGTGWKGAAGLAEDVRYYGEWMKQEAFKRIGHLYPKVKDEQGKERTVIAWIWARTVKCPNPACGCEMPLASSFVLSKKKGSETFIRPVIKGNAIGYTVEQGKNAPQAPKASRGANFTCIKCGENATGTYVRDEAKGGRMSASLMAIVAEGDRGRLYLSPTEEHVKIARQAEPEWKPDQLVTTPCHDVDRLPMYGMPTWGDAFTNRQLVALTTFSDLVAEAQAKVIADGGSEEYGKAVGVYLAFVVDRLADRGSSICSWDIGYTKIRNTFGRQAIPMTWDYAEGNPFSNSTGSVSSMVEWVYKCLLEFPALKFSEASQFDAQSDCGLRDIMVSTDPPYYDNIGYADLSDFFYVWMRQSLRKTYPDLFRTMLVPKAEELVATPYRFEGSIEKARNFFEDGMLETCKRIYQYAREDIPVTIYYAYKQSETNEDQTSSSGWETMLSAIIQAGFAITGTWPMRTEMANRSIASGTNALASSIVLVCRKRPAEASMCTRRDFINALKRELRPALAKLQASSIAPVDLAQSAIGPGMGVYSRYSKVLEADGTPMSVRSALQIINQELDLYFNEQDGELDKESRFCVELYTQCAFNDIKFGEADVLARAKNTSVDKLRADGVLYSEKGVVRLLTREEISMEANKDKGIWLLTQQLTRAIETGGIMGAAKIVKEFFTSEPERAKALAYRLFTLAERRGWAAEAYAYNSLIVAWPDVQSKAAELSAAWSNAEQQSLFASGEIFSGEV
ncbi:DUF1156 domain-containing protein [Pseudoflavonifractor sp. 524-17]|uniref:DUF1156 domain-containing protein n=1 Tax=Pseudoflavonifractor sp. 524-17 TaxID=2304577 RepID=UPI00137B2402|nr:DUF1156 domain-containing protein [Pseudoflavonifractor sp. 524-17]NCE65609.1 DUF1156 domain-containing protein [Pseudoflavonifractor sp. 524-17]